MRRVREYFYGVDSSLVPATVEKHFDELFIYRVGDVKLPSGMVPVGAAVTSDPLKVTRLEITPSLNHTLLAVSYAKTPEQAVDASVAGFVNVSKVDMERRMVTLLLPCPGDLPSNVLVHSQIKWVE